MLFTNYYPVNNNGNPIWVTSIKKIKKVKKCKDKKN